jgi:hypothetical protein
LPQDQILQEVDRGENKGIGQSVRTKASAGAAWS